MIGRTLSQFRIESKLGAGGMGEVYLAHDTRLGRYVAIKLLPAALAGDPERLARLEREARLLASLNHPNIAAIHGLEQVEGIRFLVLERVLGESLAQRLGRGALPVDEALVVARQVAEALEAAHEKGIIHRDLKPGNVMLTPDGKIKVLDFGLAKALSDEMPGADSSESPTITAMATREGVIHGTAAYMSPEQARGRPLDRRTDLWSFGCLLYELLTGRRPFQGESVQDTLAALLNTEPDWGKLPASTPPRIGVLIKRCLRKDAQQRMRDAGDARLEIDEAIAGEPAPPLSGSRPRLRLLPIASGLLVGIILGWVMLSGWRAPARVVASPAAGADWSGEMLLGGSLLAYGPRISPDGQTLAIQIMIDGISQVAIMKPGTGSWTILTRDRAHGTVLTLSWSRDGTKIYYDRNAKQVFSIPALGGEERLVLEKATSPEALPDGSLLVSRTESDRNEQFHRYWPDSGRLEAIGPRFLQPSWISTVRVFPDGQRAVFVGVPMDGGNADGLQRLQILDLITGKNRVLAPDLTFAPTSEPYRALSVSPDGRSVMAVIKSADLSRLVAIPVEGEPVIRTLVNLTASPWFAEMAADGSLILDQCTSSAEVLKFPISGGVPETVVRTTGSPNFRMNPLQLLDSRILLSSKLAGRERLLVARPGDEPRPFIDTEEETGGPAIQFGNGEVAFFIGTGPTAQVAMASADGRILRRVPATGPRGRSLAVSPDGTLFYYAEDGVIWSVPVIGGEAHKLHSGDGVVVDPRNGELIIQLNTMEATRLVRLSSDGTEIREIPFGGVAIAPHKINGRIVREDGRLVIASIPGGGWFWYPAVHDPVTGTTRQVPLRFEGDIFPASWSNDGSILAMGWRLHSEIWRFKSGAGDSEPAPK